MIPRLLVLFLLVLLPVQVLHAAPEGEGWTQVATVSAGACVEVQFGPRKVWAECNDVGGCTVMSDPTTELFPSRVVCAPEGTSGATAWAKPATSADVCSMTGYECDVAEPGTEPGTPAGDTSPILYGLAGIALVGVASLGFQAGRRG